MAHDGGRRSYELLRERVAAIPEALHTACRDRAPEEAARRLARHRDYVVAGIGGSSGPARILAGGLRRAGLASEHAPLSRFAIDGHGRPAAILAVVSQGLSPNARLALACRRRYAGTLLVTAATDDPIATEVDADHGAVIAHGPADERGLLVRVIGPTLATLAALRFTSALAGDGAAGVPADLGERVAAAGERGRDIAADLPDVDQLALVTAGDYRRMALGLRWKFLEAVGAAAPAAWDVLSFAHGPFQQLYPLSAIVFALATGCAREAQLFARLAETLVPERHRLVELPATLPYPWCWFEHDALLNAVVLSLLARRPRDLIDWPGKGQDHALYRLGASSTS